MSVTLAERPMGRDFDSQGGTIAYLAVTGPSDTEADIKAAVEAEAPDSYLGFPRGDPRAREIAVHLDGSPRLWDVEVVYGSIRAKLTPPATGTVVWSLQTTGGTQNVKAGIVPGVPYTDPSVTTLPVDWGEAIGSDKDEISGVEITIPTLTIRATKYVAAGSIDPLRRNAFLLTGRVNDAVVSLDGLEFQPGEVLFMGLSATKRTDVSPADYECVFEFQCSPNVEGLTIGTVVDIDKKGWQYLDLTYEDRESDGFKHRKLIVVTAFDVYNEGDFSVLGLE